MSTHRLMLLQTAASLHTGQPEQPHLLLRNPDSGHPTVRATTLLGALRKQIRDHMYARYSSEPDWKSSANSDNDLIRFFGCKEPAQIGALSADNASLLFLPVRSLQKGYALVTSIPVLKKLAAAVPESPINLEEHPLLERSSVLCDETQVCLLEKENLLLEELCLKRKDGLGEILSWLKAIFGDHALAEELAQRLVIVSEQVFQHFSRFAMVPEAYQNPGSGRLTYLEALPPGAYLFSRLSLIHSEQWSDLSALLPGHLFLGSHRTTGHGLCQISLITAKELVNV